MFAGGQICQKSWDFDLCQASEIFALVNNNANGETGIQCCELLHLPQIQGKFMGNFFSQDKITGNALYVALKDFQYFKLN